MVKNRRRRETQTLGKTRREQEQAQMHIEKEEQDENRNVDTRKAGDEPERESQRNGDEDQHGRNTAPEYGQNLADRSWKNHIYTSLLYHNTINSTGAYRIYQITVSA